MTKDIQKKAKELENERRRFILKQEKERSEKERKIKSKSDQNSTREG